MELKKYKLGEILDVTRGASLSGKFYAAEGEYVRLTCGNFDYQNNCFKENKAKDNLYYIGDFKPDFLMKEGDIITPLTEQAIGLLGSTAIIPESGKYIQSQDVAKIVCKEHLLDKDFAFYLISSNLVKQQLSAAAQQTKIRHTSPDKIKDCIVWIPELEEQKRIGKLLRTIDLKIELNRQLNQNLEAVIADVMDYKFLSNAETLPKRFIGDIASIKAGGDCPQEWSKYKTKDCQIPIYSNGTDNEGLYGYTKEPTILKRGITVAARGTIGYCTMRNGGYVPIIRLLAVTPNDIGGDVYLHQIFNRIKFRNDGSIQQQLTVPSLASIEIPYPNASTLKAFANITYPLIEKIKQNKIQIEELTKQRDELLPLLMNGQVSVNSDLAASYIIYKNKIIRIMKENIIQAIVAEMQRDLDCRQMARLKAVLTSELHNVEIIEKSDCATQQTQENELLLNSFISAKKIEGCSDKTLTYYRNTIERLLVTLSLAICHITTTDIRTYLSDYQEEHQSSKVTIDNMRRIFSSFFAWLEDEDYIAKSPVRRIHKVKTDSLVKEVLSDEQLEQLRDSCTTKRDLAIIDFLSSTGIRVGELVKLSREDIDFHERQCVVFGKGNKERVVYFNARTKLHLQQYLNERTDSNPALFVSLNSPHSRLTISGVEVRIRKMGQALSMPKVHPHKFRRTLATMAIDKGMPIEQVQRLLGHVRIDTTLHYAIVNQNNVKLAHKKYLG